MKKLWDWFNGNKTWIAVICAVVLSVLDRRGVEVPPWIFDVTDGILGLGLAHKAVKAVGPKAVAVAAPVLLALVALVGCGSLPGNSGFGTAGAPATAGQAAQTIGGSQGQAPGTATSGTATIHNSFASVVPPDIVTKILDMAAAEHWTAEQTVDALKAASGAPTNVTISGNQQVNSGNASSIPSTAGGSGGAGLAGPGALTRP